MNTICQNLTYSISVIVLSSVGFQKLFINKEHIIQSYLCIDCFLSPLLIDECKSLWCHKWMATSCPHVLQSSTTGVCANILFLFLGKKKKKHLLCRVRAGFAQRKHEEKIWQGRCMRVRVSDENIHGESSIAGEYTSCLRFSSRRSPRSPRNEPRVSCREHNTTNTKRNKKKCDYFSSELWHFVMDWFYSKERKANISAEQQAILIRKI